MNQGCERSGGDSGQSSRPFPLGCAEERISHYLRSTYDEVLSDDIPFDMRVLLEQLSDDGDFNEDERLD